MDPLAQNVGLLDAFLCPHAGCLTPNAERMHALALSMLCACQSQGWLYKMGFGTVRCHILGTLLLAPAASTDSH